MPMPMATTSGIPSASIWMPATLGPPWRTSLGHLKASCGASPGAVAVIASCTASAATKASWAARSGGAGSVSSSEAWRLPGSETQVRPRRPLPALWARAVIHSGRRSPARASASASALVDPTVSREIRPTPAAAAPGASCIGLSLEHDLFRKQGSTFRDHALEQGFCRGSGGVDQGRGVDKEQEDEQPGDAEHEAQLR